MKKATSKSPSAQDDALRAVFVSFMHVFGAAQQRLKDRMRTDQAGPGPLHLRLLSLCVELPGSTQQQLADALGRDKGQVAHLIRDLSERGLVNRLADPNDARLLRMHASAAGQRQAQTFIALETELARQLFEGLDTRQLAAMLEHMAHRATVHDDPGA